MNTQRYLELTRAKGQWWSMGDDPWIRDFVVNSPLKLYNLPYHRQRGRLAIYFMELYYITHLHLPAS